ncbi:MAG: type II CRISPR RNA-guided endonuclease Cas9 [Bacteroidota bacterium]
MADAKGIWNQLPLELLQEIYTSKFFRKSKAYFPFSEIRELIEHKGYKWHLNFKDKTSVTSCPVSARLKDIFGEDYLDVRVPKLNLEIEGGKDYYSLDDIWHILFNFEDQEFVANFAAEKLGLDATGVKKFITTWATLPIGYGMLSLNAIRKINRFLQRGLIYTESVLLANVPTLIGENIWMESEDYILKQISIVIDDNRRQKDILSIVNRLIAVHKNLESYEQYGGVDYQLDDEDHRDIIKAIHAHYGESNWLALKGEHATFIETAVAVCYQAYFKKSNTSIRYLAGERYFPVRSGNTEFLRGDTGFYRLPKLIDTLGEFLQLSFNIPDELLNRIYHPSEIDIYKPATDENGQLALGSPKTGAFKNPMAMRTLFSLRKLINHLINTRQIDSHTRVVVEVARELNDSNKRWAIEAWQRQREAENQEFSYAIEQLQGIHGRISALTASETDIDKIRIWFEQNDEETIPPLATAKKEVKGIRWNENVKSSYKQIVSQKQWVDKYRLWQEQQCQCMYTGKVINISDLFNDNVIDFEHTLPRSKSFDNSLANLTVCYADYNRNIKKNQIPFNLNNYDKEYGGYSAILPRLDKWKEKVERIKQQIDFWKTKSKRSSDKEYKDEAIRQKHLWSMELEYWKNKLDRFTMKEITDGFKNSQKVDTQLISKYAFHYLKTYFNKVDVQKGKMTSDFRKIYGLQVADQKKDRSKHSHHAKDAAVLTLIPTALKRDAILKEYYEAQEKKLPYSGMKPYEGFKREFVWGIDDTVLINNVPNVQYLSPAKRKVRKRGKEQYIPGTSKVMWATGDSIRGQLHQETSYGAIKPAIRDEKGLALKDEKGKYIQEDKVKYVIRVPFIYKKDPNSPGFKSLEEVEKQIVDVGLKLQIRKQVEAAESFKDAMNEGIFMLNKAGDKVNRIRHIRVWASVSDPLKIKLQTNQSDAEYKRYYYAANATNSYFALYLNDNQKAFKFRNLMETAQIKSNLNIKNPVELFDARVSVIKGRNKVELPLKYVLIAGTKVFFKKDKNEQISDLSIREQLNRLYIFTGFEKNGDSARLNFKYHLEARNKIIEEFIESEINFDHPKPTLRFGYAKYDFAVEGYDFEVAVDGAITWK